MKQKKWYVPLTASLSLALCLTLGSSALGAPSGDPSRFTDISSHWAKTNIEYMVNNGLFNGITDTTFEPNSKMSRSMAAMVLYRIEGQPNVPERSFSDVAIDAWYADPAAWVVGNGIDQGYEGSQFFPKDNITRENLADMLYHYAQFKGMDVTAGGMALKEFSDYDKIDALYKEGVAYCFYTGILNGRVDGTLDPNGYASRAEVAAMFERFLESTVPTQG